MSNILEYETIIVEGSCVGNYIRRDGRQWQQYWHEQRQIEAERYCMWECGMRRYPDGMDYKP